MLLVRDEIRLREQKNLANAKSFHGLLEATPKRCHDRLIDAAVVRALVEIHKDMEAADRRSRDEATIPLAPRPG